MGPQTINNAAQRFEYEDKRQQITDIEAMITDFRRIADDLDLQIEAEQRASGITDINHFAYPTFARAAIARRDNLRSSIRELEQRLGTAKQELAELEEQIKNAQVAEGLDMQRFSKPTGRRKNTRYLGALGSSS